MKRVLKYIRKYTPALVLSLLLAGLTVLLTLYIPILTGNAVDLIIGKGQVDMAGIFAIMKKIAIAMIITAVGQWIMNTCNNYITYHVIRDIRTDAFAKLEILPLKYLDAHAYGDIVSRVIADVDTFADGLLMGFTQLFTGALTILCTLGFMLVTNVPITLVVVCITPVSFLVAKFIATKTYSMFKEQSETRGRADLPDRGNDRQPEDCKYLFQRRSGEEQVWRDQRQIAEMLSESYLFLLHYEPGDPFC